MATFRNDIISDIWILVLHWQGPEITRACLESLAKLDYPAFKVLLVDNGSLNNDGERLAQDFPQISLLRLDSNRGFAGGCNAGIDYCLEKGASWIWLINNDAQVAPDSLSLLTAASLKHDGVGALSGLVYADEEENLSGRGEIDFLKAKSYLRPCHSNQQKAIECDWLSGSNLLLNAKAIKSCGPFDDSYFLYFEDTELCWRLRLKGFKLLLVPQSKIKHTGGASTSGKRKVWRAYYHTRNRFLFFLKYAKSWQKPVAFLSISAHILRHCLSLPLKGEDGRRQLRAELLGTRDYFTGALGEAKCLDWCE